MNKIFPLVLGVLAMFSSCAQAPPYQLTNDSMEKKIVIGEFPRSVMEQETVFAWFKDGYKAYSPNPELLTQIAQQEKIFSVLVYLGSWCGDSKREVPRFMKICDMTGISAASVKFHGLDRMKKSPDGSAGQYQIERVPTFIIFRGAREIGRIIEFPETSLEDDLLRILKR